MIAETAAFLNIFQYYLIFAFDFRGAVSQY